MTPDLPADTTADPLDEVERYLSHHPDTEAVELLITDTNAVMRGKWAPAGTIEKAFTSGVAFPLSMFGLDVWGREVMETGLHVDTGDRDGFCKAVPGSLRPVPWADVPTAQVVLTMTTETGKPFHGDPRHALEAVVARAAKLNLRACVAFELEFYLLTGRTGEAQAEALRPVLSLGDGPDRQNMYALSDLSAHSDFFAAVRAGAKAQGLPIDTILSEAAPGQFEINLKHRVDAMAAADDALLLKRLVQETARRHGLRATFMAKPFMPWAGNGMHCHVSMVDIDGANIFADASKGQRTLEHAVAGLLEGMAPAMLVFVPTWNGYRRLLPGSYAPTRVAWGHNNRSVAVRIPAGEAAATRIEHRIAGADANPYLVLAAILAAMLDGIEEQRVPPPPTDRNAYEAPAPQLPDDMQDAVRLFRKSDFIRRTFGVEYRAMYAAIKEAEISAFRSEISPLERSTYL
ncbi:glutamine synthetase family protein [Amorphus sp. 3PC139-8]|uniref:glutamine synthetase family protein n=1 Tax=Amorphus sp. 3PC139-8 TaxID=2735676 RepID=UPI00345C86BA